MDRTIRALTDLCTVDDQLSEKEALLGGLTRAFEERRAALREAIPGAFLAAYDALGRLGRRPVIVPVRDAHCGGCHLRLPPKVDSSIRRRQSLCSCPHCRRLLYSVEIEKVSESKCEPPDRPATKVRPPDRVRRPTGRRPARQEHHTAKRRGPHGKRAGRGGERRGEAPPAQTNPVER